MKLYHHIHKLSYRFNNISFNIRNLQLFSTNSNNLSNSNKKKEVSHMISMLFCIY